jgi:hypothetical protein
MVFKNKKKGIKAVVQLGTKGSGFFASEQVDEMIGRMYYYDLHEEPWSFAKMQKSSMEDIIDHDYHLHIGDIKGSYLKAVSISKGFI